MQPSLQQPALHARTAAQSPEPTPAERRFAKLHDELRRRIVLYRYPPGHRLDLDALAAEFDVSRTPLRSVLQRLALDGLVVSRHGVATQVRPLEPAELRQAIAFRMRLAELIGELDPLAPTPETIRTIDEVREGAGRLGAMPDLDAFALIDLRLHDAIRSLIGNLPLHRAYDQAYHATARMWRLLLPSLDWSAEVAVFGREIEQQHSAIHRGDVRAVGYNTRNALSAVLHRLADHF